MNTIGERRENLMANGTIPAGQDDALINEPGEANTTYTLDAVANRLGKATDHSDNTKDETTTNSYVAAGVLNRNNWLLSSSTTKNGVTTATTFAYDPNGSLTSESSSGSPTITRTYDLRNGSCRCRGRSIEMN